MMMVYPKIIASTIWTGSRNGKLFGVFLSGFDKDTPRTSRNWMSLNDFFFGKKRLMHKQ